MTDNTVTYSKIITNINNINLDKYMNITYSPTLLEIKIKINSAFKKEITIKNVDKYVFNPLVRALSENSNDFDIDWCKYKFLKPINYNSDLFVCLKREIWGNLLIGILNSNVYEEARDKLYENSQINFFSLKDLISNIIDKIAFISYKTSFFGVTRKNTFKIYVKGLFNKQIKNKSIALLKFYAFIISTLIHEIGGHINVKLQLYYNSKDFKNSPDINNFEDYENLYTNSAKLRGKESGETLEILLFGRVLRLLTVKESLFVLNIDNYSQDLETFKKNFQECEKKPINTFLTNDSLKSLLRDLDIIPEEINEQDNIKYGEMDSIKNDDSENCLVPEIRHPFGFYIKDNLDVLKKLYNNYKEK